MPRNSHVMTPEEYRVHQARQARLSQKADATIAAGLEAARRGEDIGAAIRAANAVFAERPAGGLPDPSPTSSPDSALEDRPRLGGDGWTAECQRLFLTTLATTGCVSDACAAVGLSRQSAYKLRRRVANSVFAIGWDVAIHIARQALLDEMTERAFRGREVPIVYRGEQVGTRIVHNDRLAMFLLARKPDPIHPALDARELTQLFPTMLKIVDVILPPALNEAKARAQRSDYDENGND